MQRIAIIKTGATGDVVRTTVLLHLFENDQITWITAKHNMVVLPYTHPNLRILAIEDIQSSGIFQEQFNLVISLDDDLNCARLASSLQAKELFGAYLSNDRTVYTTSANEWFDMGLSSRFGKEKADEIKWNNKCSYQEILYRMLGHIFDGEEYLIREDIVLNTQSRSIGIEARAGNRWPTKVWNKYGELSQRLQDKGHELVFFEEREHMKDYMQDIANTAMLVCGDTLGMHIALALRIPVVAIFTCTSPVEIYGYGRMRKIVSPHLKDAYYKTDYIFEAVDSIATDTVWDAVKKQTSKLAPAAISR